MSLPRSAVAAALYQSVKERVDVRFGDSLTDIQEDVQGLDVQFRNSQSARFDFVFGADGVHSAVRRLAFGKDAESERFLGYYVAAFSALGYAHRDPHVYVAYGKPGKQIWRVTLNDDVSVFLLLFAQADPQVMSVSDSVSQKDFLARIFEGSGWESGEMIVALESANDLYFDRVSQVIMPMWTTGRIALLGDACACPSLLAGEGSSMAMTEAYILAGELHAAGGNHERAFLAYEQQMRPYVERKQKGALGFVKSFVPKSAFGLRARDTSINLASRLGLTRWLLQAQFQDPLELRHYH